MLSIIESIISIFIMYKCCEKFDFKITWAIYTSLYVLFAVIQGGFSVFFMALVIYAIMAAIVVLVYYKIYDHCNNSFWTFFGLSLLVQLAVAIVVVILGAISVALITSNGILSTY